MTVHDLGNAIIYVGAVAGALTGIGLLLRYVVVRPLKHWVTEQAAPARHASDELSSDHGRSTKDLVQKIHDRQNEIAYRVDGLSDAIVTATTLAGQALAIAQNVSQRLDQHIVDHKPWRDTDDGVDNRSS